MRTRFRHLLLNLLGSFSRPSKSLYILNGHYVNLNAGKTDADMFEHLLVELSHFFEFIPFEEACNKITNHKNLTKPAISFTFDDGFKECHTVIAPILEKFGTNACFFINPSVIEASEDFKKDFLQTKLKLVTDKQFMSWNEISDLQERGHVIGNHTMNHRALLSLSYEEAFQEVNLGKNELEIRLNYTCNYFAIPYGNPLFFDETGLKASLACHPFVFTSYKHKNYFYDKNPSILERRHFEGNWPISHIKYFLSVDRRY